MKELMRIWELPECNKKLRESAPRSNHPSGVPIFGAARAPRRGGTIFYPLVREFADEKLGQTASDLRFPSCINVPLKSRQLWKLNHDLMKAIKL